VILAVVKLIKVEVIWLDAAGNDSFSSSYFLMDRTSLARFLQPWQGVEGFEEFMTLIEIPNVYNSDTAVTVVLVAGGSL
jgi:hypothetical protein